LSLLVEAAAAEQHLKAVAAEVAALGGFLITL
jgi:hypothetical protein